MTDDYFDINKINELNEKYAGLRNRYHGRDKTYKLPTMTWVYAESKCFVTQSKHIIIKGDPHYCIECDKILLEV